MVEQLPASEGALMVASSDETRVLGAGCEQPGLKELTKLFLVWLDHVHRCQSQARILHVTYEMWPLCLGLFELEMIILCAFRNVHPLKEGYNVNTLCAILLRGVYVVLWRLRQHPRAWNSSRTQAVIKKSDEVGVFVEWGDVEQLFYPGEAVKEGLDLRIAQG